MRKLFLLISVVAIAITSIAQDAKFGAGTYAVYEPTTVTPTGSAGTLSKVFAVQKDYIYLYSIQATLDSVSGGGRSTLYIDGSNDNVTYYNITSRYWEVTASATNDTTISFADLSTGVVWRYIRFRLTGGTSTSVGVGKYVMKIASKP